MKNVVFDMPTAVTQTKSTGYLYQLASNFQKSYLKNGTAEFKLENDRKTDVLHWKIKSHEYRKQNIKNTFSPPPPKKRGICNLRTVIRS